MILISHRGNIEFSIKKSENTVEYINKAIDLGFHVEIDIWFFDKKWFLGHDKPENIVDYNYLLNDKFWIHCKNQAAYKILHQNPDLNVFYQTTEKFVITSKNYIWMHENTNLLPNSICVLPENGIKGDIKKCCGICSDEIIKYKNL